MPWALFGTGPGFAQTVDPSWAIWPLMLFVYLPRICSFTFYVDLVLPANRQNLSGCADRLDFGYMVPCGRNSCWALKESAFSGIERRCKFKKKMFGRANF